MRALAAAVCLLLAPLASAQVGAPGVAPGQLAGLLASADQHPAVRAAAAALEAAKAQLRAARSPVHFDVNSSLTLLDVDEIDVNPVLPGVQPLERTLLNVSAGLSFRPFAFGDIRDLVDQREVAVAQAELDLREALVGMQVRALTAAYEAELARDGLEVALQGAELAREALAATALRAQRGAASQRDVREAERGVAEAEGLVLDARENLELAELGLLSLLVGSPAPRDLPDIDVLLAALPPPPGEPVDALRAGLQARLAELAPRGAQRALLPVAQASYSFNLGEHDTLSLSLESRTLQPSVGFSHEAVGRSFPQTEIRGAFTVGVAWSIAPESFAALDAAEAQLEAARLGLEATLQGTEVRARALAVAVDQAERSLALARARHQDAAVRLAETEARLQAGLTAPLELQSDALALTRAQVELRSASLGALRSRLDLYVFAAVPLSPSPEDHAR